MKNLFTFLLLTLVIFSCKTKEEKLISDAESYIKDSIITKINDPDSYQLVSTNIIDTVKYKAILISDANRLKNNISSSKYLISLYQTNLSLLKSNNKSLKYLMSFYNSYYELYDYKNQYNDNINQIDDYNKLIKEKNQENISNQKFYDAITNSSKNIDTSEIGIISIRQVYRYKNTLGGVMLDTANIYYANRNIEIKSMSLNFKKGFNHTTQIVPVKSFRLN
jgi:hypothetical protein